MNVPCISSLDFLDVLALCSSQSGVIKKPESASICKWIPGNDDRWQEMVKLRHSCLISDMTFSINSFRQGWGWWGPVKAIWQFNYINWQKGLIWVILGKQFDDSSKQATATSSTLRRISALSSQCRYKAWFDCNVQEQWTSKPTLCKSQLWQRVWLLVFASLVRTNHLLRIQHLHPYHRFCQTQLQVHPQT